MPPIPPVPCPSPCPRFPPTPALRPAPAPSSSSAILSRAYSFSLWRKGIAFSCYCFVLAKLPLNSSRSLTSVKFGFLGKNLLFCSCSVHFKLTSRHLPALLEDNCSIPVKVSSDLDLWKIFDRPGVAGAVLQSPP